MALHSKHSIRHRLNDEVYVSADLAQAMPKYRFPEPERDPRAVYAAVHDELMLDGNARHNLATFCQTWEEPELHKLMDECIDKNIVDMAAGIPALCWTIKAGTNPGFSLYDLSDRLRSRGWQVPAYSLPSNCEDVVVQRILVRQGVTRDLCSLLVEDMKRALEYFSQRPVQTPLTAAEASGFHH